MKSVGFGRKNRPQLSDDSWKAYLDRDERIVWTGAPGTGLRFRSSNLIQSGMGLFFTGFSVFWMSQAMKAGGVFWMFGLIFFFAGLYMLVGQYFYEALARSNTRYALTDKRALIAVNLFGKRMKSYPVDEGTPLEFEPGDEASVFFGTKTVRTKNGTRDVRIGFEYLRDGREVYELMRKVQTNSI